MRICARYLVSRRADGRPRDPVARFHLRNGARLERINWLGDVSRKGLRQSVGMMVNYRYRIDDIEENHESYERDGRIVAASSVRSLLRGRKDAEGRALTRYTEGSPDAEDEDDNGEARNGGRKRKAGRSAAKAENTGESEGAGMNTEKADGGDKEPAA